MADLPSVHITNWPSRTLHGPGRRFSIMRNPRAWEWGEGRVLLFLPLASDLADVREERISFREYAARCLLQFSQHPEQLPPGELLASDRGVLTAVRHGDTLLCSCSGAQAARGRCHRVIAAELLAGAGWRVILDGEEMSAESLRAAREAR